MTASLGLHPKSDRAYLKEATKRKYQFRQYQKQKKLIQEIQKSDLLKINSTVGQQKVIIESYLELDFK